MPYPLPCAHAPPCLLRCVSPLPSHLVDCLHARLLPALRLAGAGRVIVSSCHLPSSNRIAAWLRLLAYRRRGLISSGVPSCDVPLACVASRLCRLISSVIASPVSSPFLDTVGLGVRRGASASCLLGFAPAVCADVDSRFVPYPLRCPLGLLAYWFGYGGDGDGVLILSCGVCCGVLLARHLGSSLVSSRRSGQVMFLSPRLSTRWTGRGANAVCLLSVLRSILSSPVSFPCACLPRVVLIPVPLSARPDVDGGGRRAVCRLGVAACLPVSLYPCRDSLSSRRSAVPSHGSFDWCGSVPCPDVVGMGSEAVMPCRASSRPPRLPCGVSLLKRRGWRRLPRHLFYCLRFAFRLARCPVSAYPLSSSCLLISDSGRFPSVRCRRFALSSPRLAPRSTRVEGRGGINPFSLLACPAMSSWSWRCRIICGGGLPCCYLPRACFVGCGSPLVPLISLFSIARPVCSCRGAWSLGVGFHCPPCSYRSRVGCGRLLAS